MASELFKQVAQTTENLHNSQISQEPNTMSAPRESVLIHPLGAIIPNKGDG